MRRTALIYLKILIAALVLGGMGLYAYLQSSEYLLGPTIEIRSPQNGSTVSESYIEIIGRARNASELTLNDRPISTDTEGNFREELLLAPGYTIITLKARDKFNRQSAQTLELVFKTRATNTAQIIL